MPTDFLHGVEVVQVETGARPIRTVTSSVIGIVGTAPNADADAFPINTPVAVTSLKEAALLGDSGTLPTAADGIYDQSSRSSPVCVFVRVDEGVDDEEAKTNVIGGYDENQNAEGFQVLTTAKSVLGLEPRILIAPGFTDDQAVLSDFVSIADKLRGMIYADGPNTTDADAIAYRGNFGSRRVLITDPGAKVRAADGSTIDTPASARIAGLRAILDVEQGFWHSVSNREINGIIGTSRPVEFQLGDPNSRANLLNAAEVQTIIRETGFRTWGGRTTSSDARWAFEPVVRTADIINDSLQRAHLWAVDKNITKGYVEAVVEGVRNYLRFLKGIGAILGGDCWANSELNTPDQTEAGRVYFDFDFTPAYPAERVTFQSIMTNGYAEAVFE